MKCVMGIIACVVGLASLIGLIVLKAVNSSATYMDCLLYTSRCV